jgi:hypothetical protein
MKRSFLERLQRAALLSLIGALLLLLVVPGLQLLVLGPQGYGVALTTPQASLTWIQGHTFLFLLYRLSLILGFALLLALPFALFRIIIAQEIVGRAEIEQDDEDVDEEDEAEEEAEKDQPKKAETVQEENGMPAFAWRGKGFAVIAAWAGLLGLLLVAGGTLASTIYLWSSANAGIPQGQLPDNFATVTSLLAVLTYTVGGGLLAISCIFFGLVIARSGRKLWPDGWVAFSYMALITGAIASGSAVQVALAPTGDQATLTTPAILLIALWSLWFSIMVTRLKAEQ